jgi:hypothetical protein
VRLTDYWWLAASAPIAKPTRDQLTHSRLHFGGQDVTLPRYGTIPWFDAALQALTPDERQIVYAMKRASGDTMVMLALWWAYSDASCVYPVNNGFGIDFSTNWAGYKALIQEAIDNGFCIELKLACEGQQRVPGQLGYFWAMQQAPALMAYLSDVLPWCVVSLGFELLGEGGNWSDQQVTDAHLMLRQAVGDNAIALELGEGYNKWNAGQSDPDDGTACWATSAGQAIDVFEQEFPQPLEEGDHWRGCEILSRRNLGPSYSGPSDPADPNPPFYFAHGTPRGPHVVWAYEYALYDWVRGNIAAPQYAQYRNAFAGFGYDVVG